MIRPEVLHMAEEMETVLAQNDHKPHWRLCTPSHLYSSLLDEVQELIAQVPGEITIQGTPTASLLRIRHECLDIANYCMMLVDVIDHHAHPAPERTPAGDNI